MRLPDILCSAQCWAHSSPLLGLQFSEESMLFPDMEVFIFWLSSSVPEWALQWPNATALASVAQLSSSQEPASWQSQYGLPGKCVICYGIFSSQSPLDSCSGG